MSHQSPEMRHGPAQRRDQPLVGAPGAVGGTRVAQEAGVLADLAPAEAKEGARDIAVGGQQISLRSLAGDHDDLVLAAALACWKATYKRAGSTRLRIIR